MASQNSTDRCACCWYIFQTLINEPYILNFTKKGLFSNCAKLPEPHIDMLVGNLDILKSIDMSETNSITIDDSDHSDCLICMESISIHVYQYSS